MTPLSELSRERALDLLAPMTARRPRVLRAEALGSKWAPVTRLHLDVAVCGTGRTVVVKTTRQGAGDWGVIEHLRRERAALNLLSGSGVAPTLLAADDEFELIVMSDIAGASLEAVLLGADPVTATAAVVGLGDALGRIHVATLGRESEHLEAMAGAGSPRRAGERYGMWTGVDGWEDIERAAFDLGLPSARRARRDVAHVCEQLVAPGPFLALTHTDPSPPNAIVSAAGVALVDYEGSGFRHVALDAAWLHFPFPNYSAHYAIIPQHVIEAADAAYRARLSSAIPEATDDDQYDAMLSVGLAAALVVRAQRLKLLASENQQTYDSWRRRTQLHQQIQVLVQRCASNGQLSELADWFAQLALAMAERWPDAGTPPAPLFPAFAAANREERRTAPAAP